MAQQSTVALAENSSLIPNTEPSLTLVPRILTATHSCTHMHAGKTFRHIKE